MVLSVCHLIWVKGNFYTCNNSAYSISDQRQCGRFDLILESHGRDHMVVGFTTTYAISAYHYWYCEFESRSGRGVQHYVIKFISDLQQAYSSTNKTDRHDITEILLKVSLNTIKQTNQNYWSKWPTNPPPPFSWANTMCRLIRPTL